jgi:hypothetical protein
MDKQNSPATEEMQNTNNSNSKTIIPNIEEVNSSPKSKKILFMGAFLGLVLIIILLTFFVSSSKNKVFQEKDVTNTQQEPSSPSKATITSGLESLYSSIESTYGGNVPWSNINNKLAYKFYPKEVNGLTVANDEVSTNHDGNYNSLTVFKLTDSSSVPLKNAYITYYEVPDVLRKRFNLGEMDIVMPLELKVYELDRKLNENEKSIIVKGENFRCTNEKSKTETSSFTNQQIVVYYCDINLTDDQKTQVRNKGFFDKIYEIYFVDRNILIQFGVDSAYINNPQEYLSDYLSKIFNSNDSLFVSQTQIRSVEDSRKFEEWRSKTFDNK